MGRLASAGPEPIAGMSKQQISGAVKMALESLNIDGRQYSGISMKRGRLHGGSAGQDRAGQGWERFGRRKGRARARSGPPCGGSGNFGVGDAEAEGRGGRKTGYGVRDTVAQGHDMVGC